MQTAIVQSSFLYTECPLLFLEVLGCKGLLVSIIGSEKSHICLTSGLQVGLLALQLFGLFIHILLSLTQISLPLVEFGGKRIQLSPPGSQV